MESGRSSLKGCLQLMLEYDYYTSSSAVQTMKLLLGKEAGYFPDSISGDVAGQEIATWLLKNNGNINYEFLQVPNIPGHMDYNEVVFILCQVLQQVYKRLLDPVMAEKGKEGLQ